MALPIHGHKPHALRAVAGQSGERADAGRRASERTSQDHNMPGHNWPHTHARRTALCTVAGTAGYVTTKHIEAMDKCT